ncbi:MAG: hypothetical protein COA90_09470 [Gammaproteobacteria bacterium]|nr:MAG: hypothetical protein COA90_09470 [Gammaproteobacteria bacterium]
MSELYFPSLSAKNNDDDGPNSVSELQGALCGLLCLNAQADRNQWYKSLFEDFSPDDDEILDLTTLFDQTIQSLNSLDFDFQLDIPTDDAPIASRIIALSDWSQGLIYGLGTSGLTDNTELSTDAKEFIADVINISQISGDDVEESNEEEENLEELIEYLRMGLFLIFGELQPVAPADPDMEH